MKQIHTPKLFLFAVLAILSLFFISTPSNAQDNTDAKIAPEKPSSIFVEMNDGSIRNFSSLKLVTGIMMTPHLVADGRIVINGNEIKSYRDNDHYAISQKTFESGHRSYLAIEILPGFVERIATGKINIYDKKYFNGYRKVDEFFVQSGSNGPIVPYSASLVNDMVKDDPEAIKFLNNKNKLPLLKKLQLTADIINKNASLVSKN